MPECDSPAFEVARPDGSFERPRCANLCETQTMTVVAPVTVGKLNAIRAAFKAGVTPSRTARESGIAIRSAKGVGAIKATP
jgi:hypothetical protein